VRAKAHILKTLIADNIGLKVEIQTGTNPVVYEGMDKGSIHIHPETWLPNQQNLVEAYVKKRGTVVLGPKYTESKNGMCVLNRTAAATGVTRITDLSDPKKAALFDTDGDGKGEIFIGAPGWASTPIEQVRARDYGYDQTFKLLMIEDAVAYGLLDSAIASGKHWVGYCSDVHFAFQKYDIRQLEEPPHDPASWKMVQPTEDPNWFVKSRVSTGWKPAHLHVSYAKSLRKTHPDVARLLDNMSLTRNQVVELSYAIGVERRDPEKYAREWTVKNAELVASWLTR
jgi:glycine betaine/proline transport system substrate-binding protein